MVLSNVVGKVVKESFQNSDNVVAPQGPTGGQMFVLIIMVVLWLCLVLLVGKYLWNECLCKVVTVCRKIDNVFVLLGLVVLFDILHPNM